MRHFPTGREWGRLVVLAALNIGFFQGMLFVAAYRLPGGLTVMTQPFALHHWLR